mgnify:CR=1 FL=1
MVNKNEVMQMALTAIEHALLWEGDEIPVAGFISDLGNAAAALRAALAQPEPEPVALNLAYTKQLIAALYENSDPVSVDAANEFERLLTAPPQRKPLSNDEIKKLHHLIDWANAHTYKDFARAIEAAHGIGVTK